MALAASLLLAVGLLLTRSGNDPQVAEARTYNSAKKLLEDRQFDEARQLLSSSADKGIASVRLSSLRSQAVREMPSLFALASAGRLTDFGFSPIAGPIFKDFMTDPAELCALIGGHAGRQGCLSSAICWPNPNQMKSKCCSIVVMCSYRWATWRLPPPSSNGPPR